MLEGLSRGIEIIPGVKLGRLILKGRTWRVYESSVRSLVLLATENQAIEWKNYTGTLTFQQTQQQCMLASFDSSCQFISMLYGPFPGSERTVEEVTRALGTFRNTAPGITSEDGLYISDGARFLPCEVNGEDARNMDALLGNWITGGVQVSAKEISQIESLTGWIAREKLHECLRLAGVIPVNLKNSSEHPGSDVINRNVVKTDGDRFHLEGRSQLEAFLNDNIVDVIQNSEAYQRMGIGFPGATILYGPPGCGKTYAVDRLAEFLGWKRFDIDANSIASPYIHDTSKKIAEVFRQAISNAPSILIVDEMEAFLSTRNTSSSNQHHTEEVAEFLRRIPEAIENHVLIFAMTNMIEAIDPAILRTGRFDHHFEVSMPSASEIESLLRKKLATLPVSDDIDFRKLSIDLEGHPLSDVTFIVKEAGRFAVKNHKDVIDMICLQSALEFLMLSNSSVR